MHSHNFKAFDKWCIENNQEEYLDMWDYESNQILPSEVPSTTKQKMAFKCQNPDHPTFYKAISGITSSRNKHAESFCPACGSIGQYIIDTQGKEYLDAIWSEKNEKSYFEISRCSQQKIWIHCLGDKNHPDYEVSASNYVKGSRCPYCAGHKVCAENNLLTSIPEIIDIWSDKNEKSPDQYSAHSNAKVWLKCGNGVHKDFQRRICNIQTYSTECPKCMNKRIGEEKRQDLTGMTFGRLTVLCADENADTKNGIRYICQCSCENHTIKSILGSHLTSGKIRSCGCYWREQITGKNNWTWKGGITKQNDVDRGCGEYKAWHSEVLRRDHYTCQCCGATSNLEVHHILNFSDYEDLRYETSNGITLCRDCHCKDIPGSFHDTYGTSNNTPEQLEEYINTTREELGIKEHFDLVEYLQTSEEIENMNHKRICRTCGAEYQYCPTCNSYKNLPKWMALFDKQICKDVFDIVSAYNTGSLSASEAKAKLMELDLNGATFKDSVQSKIDEIMSTGEVEESTIETLHDGSCAVVEPKSDLDGEIVNGFSSEPIVKEPETEFESAVAKLPEDEATIASGVAELPEDSVTIAPEEYDLDAAIEAEKDEEATLKPHRVHKHKAKFRAGEQENNENSDVNSIN